MDTFQQTQIKIRTLFIFSIFLTLFLCGCTSIHSDSVRALIDIETDKINQAKVNASKFVSGTDSAIASWKASVDELSKSVEVQKTIESVHALVFSSNQNIATKTGVDAQAAGYLIGELYLAERVGLEQMVLDQFEEDYRALKELAKKIQESWAALSKTQKMIDEFSDRSVLSTVDIDLARALITEFGSDTTSFDEVLKRSKQVNEMLKKVSSLGLLGDAESKRAQTVTQDVIDLLERIKK